MRRLSEHEMSLRLLECRDQGFSVADVLRRHRLAYFSHLALVYGSFVAYGNLDDRWSKNLSLFFAGMLVGALFRDLGFLRRQKAIWPFSAKVMDWGEIEAIAAAEKSVNSSRS